LPHLSSTSTRKTPTPYTSFLPPSISHNETSGKYCSDITDQDKSSIPIVCCGSCQSTLEGWLCGTRKCTPLTVPRNWR